MSGNDGDQTVLDASIFSALVANLGGSLSGGGGGLYQDAGADGVTSNPELFATLVALEGSLNSTSFAVIAWPSGGTSAYRGPLVLR